METDWEKGRRIFFVMFGIIIIMLSSFYIGVFKGEDKKQMYILNELKNNIKDKNLSMTDELYINNRWASSYGFESYKEYVLKNYEYSFDLKDCKYWSLNWALYLESKDINYKFVETNNHLFVMTYDENGYCVLDLNYTMCRGMVLN